MGVDFNGAESRDDGLSLRVGQSGQFDDVFQRFEAAWRAGKEPQIDQYVAELPRQGEPHVACEAIRVLALIDMEWRWRCARPDDTQARCAHSEDTQPKGSLSESLPLPDAQTPVEQLPPRPLLEHYLTRFPSMGAIEDVPVSLVVEEYCIRHRWGDRPGHGEYIERFGDRDGELAEALVDADRQKEQPAPADDPSGIDQTFALDSPPKTTEGSGDSDAIGRPLGRYRIVRELGAGAMGSVYLAEDTELQREVALKIPKFADQEEPEFLERFHREARAAATLNHTNICQVYDIGEHEGTRYITMAYVGGPPLSDLVGSPKLRSERTIAKLVRKIAVGVAEAHSKGILHRDLKPGNIILDERNEPVITDFGLARRADQSVESRLTQDGTLLGTPAYMSPEQIGGDPEKMGPASDVYSLGVILYEMLTGELPFRGSITSVIGQILQGEPKPPSELRPDLDKRIEAICLKMMAKSADVRFSSAREVIAALNQYLKENADAAKTNALKKEAEALEERLKQALRDRQYDGLRENVLDRLLKIDPGNQMARDVFEKLETYQPDQPLQFGEDGTLLPARDDNAAESFPVFEPTARRRIGPSTSRKGRRKATHTTATASRFAIPIVPVGIGLASLTFLVLAIVFFLRDGKQTVKVEIDPALVNDPTITVWFDGKEMEIRGIGKTIKLKPGEYGYEIRRGDEVIEARKFTVLKKGTPALQITLEGMAVGQAPPDEIRPETKKSSKTTPSSSKVALAPWEGRKSPSSRPTSRESAAIPEDSDQPFCVLHFEGPDQRVELKDTKRVASANGVFTAEVWVRWAIDKHKQDLFGTFVPKSRIHPATNGWDLGLWGTPDCRWRMSARYGGSTSTQGMSHNSEFLPFSRNEAVGWHHIALTKNEQDQVVAYLDGKETQRFSWSVGKDAEVSNLRLGSTPHFAPYGLHGQVRAFRLSSVCRYGGGTIAVPKSYRFDKDADTVVLLDFDNPQEGTIADVSGNGHHGTLTGVRWIQVVNDELLAVGQPLAPLSDDDRSPPTVSPEPPSEPIHVLTTDETTTSLAISPIGELLVSGLENGTIVVWDLKAGRELKRMNGHTAQVMRLVFSPDGKAIVSGGMDGVAIVWEVGTWRERREHKGSFDRALMHQLHFSHDGATLIIGGYTSPTLVCDAESGEVLHSFDGYIDALALSPDAKTLAIAKKEAITLYDVETGQQKATLNKHTKKIDGLSFSPDGQTLASCSDDNSLRFWDVPNGTEKLILADLFADAKNMNFSSDGRWIAAGIHASMKLWNAQNGKVALTLNASRRDRISAAAISPDATLAAGAWEKTILVWHIHPILYPEANPRDSTAVPEDSDQPFNVLHFEGPDQQVELKDTKHVASANGEFTAEVWVKWTAGEPNHELLGTYVCRTRLPHKADNGWDIMLKTIGGRLSVTLRGGGSDKPIGWSHGTYNDPVPEGWHHVAATKDAQGQMAAYLDGNEYLRTAWPCGTDAELSNLRLGDQLGSVPSRSHFPQHGLHGQIRAFRLSSVCRYSAESFAVPTSHRFDKDADTVVLLDFEDPKEGMITDVSGNGHHGTLTGVRWMQVGRSAASGASPDEPQPEAKGSPKNTAPPSKVDLPPKT